MAEKGDHEVEYAELVTVYIPINYEEYIVAVPILDEHNIRHLDRNAVLYRGMTAGIVGCVSPAVGPIEVQVSKEDAAKAKRLLDGVLKKIRKRKAG